MSERLKEIQYLTDDQEIWTIRRLNMLSRTKLTLAARGIAWLKTDSAGGLHIVIDKTRFYTEAEKFIPFMAEASGRTLAEAKALDLVSGIGIFGAVIEVNLLSVANTA